MDHTEETYTKVTGRGYQAIRIDGTAIDDDQRVSSTWHYHPPLQRQSYFRHKYLIERITGLILLILAAPVILLVSILVKLTSAGAALYSVDSG